VFSRFIPVFKLLEERLIAAEIKAPFALLQVIVKVLAFDAVKPIQMAFSLPSEVFNAVDVVVVLDEAFVVVNPPMFKGAHIIIGADPPSGKRPLSTLIACLQLYPHNSHASVTKRLRLSPSMPLPHPQQHFSPTHLTHAFFHSPMGSFGFEATLVW
jgi:hypothetical protein